MLSCGCAQAVRVVRGRSARLQVQCKAVEPKKILMMGAFALLWLYVRAAHCCLCDRVAACFDGRAGASSSVCPSTPSPSFPPHQQTGGTRFIGVYLARQLVEQVCGA